MASKYDTHGLSSFVQTLVDKGYYDSKDHQYIILSDSSIADFKIDLCCLLLNQYLPHIKHSTEAWKTNNNEYTIRWTNPYTGMEEISKPVNFNILIKHLKENDGFVPKKLNLLDFRCPWLDIPSKIQYDQEEKKSSAIKYINPQQLFENDQKVGKLLYSAGNVFTSFHTQLVRRIISERKKLIWKSNNASHYSWILELRSIINDTLCLVDITLNQLYTKAESLPEKGWVFDKQILGDRFERRLIDKIKWITLITGKTLNYEVEWDSLNRLQIVRNDLNHFDPSSFKITVEAATTWLNDIVIVGRFLQKVREALQLPISTDLINFILQKEAVSNLNKGVSLES